MSRGYEAETFEEACAALGAREREVAKLRSTIRDLRRRIRLARETAVASWFRERFPTLDLRRPLPKSKKSPRERRIEKLKQGGLHDVTAKYVDALYQATRIPLPKNRPIGKGEWWRKPKSKKRKTR